jgi:hypothetical protein
MTCPRCGMSYNNTIGPLWHPRDMPSPCTGEWEALLIEAGRIAREAYFDRRMTIRDDRVYLVAKAIQDSYMEIARLDAKLARMLIGET